ncbi:protein Flattop homolog [Centruroides vittatus]|uniref:protein Flattop homolog n=1 Tax=Centruroides vittatus TaxID=120091 RepID=UPI00350EBE0C
MSTNFSANQYEDAFISTRLCQYQICRNFIKWPKRRIGGTKPIVDDNGYLFTRKPIDRNSPRSDIHSPWEPIHKGPGTVKGISVKPGIWLVSGRRANWIETKYDISLEQNIYDHVNINNSHNINRKLFRHPWL